MLGELATTTIEILEQLDTFNAKGRLNRHTLGSGSPCDKALWLQYLLLKDPHSLLDGAKHGQFLRESIWTALADADQLALERGGPHWPSHWTYAHRQNISNINKGTILHIFAQGDQSLLPALQERVLEEWSLAEGHGNLVPRDPTTDYMRLSHRAKKDKPARRIRGLRDWLDSYATERPDYVHEVVHRIRNG